MAKSTSKIGYGIKIERDDGAGNYTKLAELKSLTPPKLHRDLPEATHTDSPDGYKEYVAGLKDGGQIQGDFAFVSDAAQTSVLSDFEDGADHNYKITFPNGKVWTAPCKVQDWGPAQVDIANPMAFNVVLKVNGKPTIS